VWSKRERPAQLEPKTASPKKQRFSTRGRFEKFYRGFPNKRRTLQKKSPKGKKQGIPQDKGIGHKKKKKKITKERSLHLAVRESRNPRGSISIVYQQDEEQTTGYAKVLFNVIKDG